MKNKNLKYLALLGGLLLLLSFGYAPFSFKSDQLKHTSVQKAYQDKEKKVKDNLAEQGIKIEGLQVTIRVYKEEGELELWGKNKEDTNYKRLEVFKICFPSGDLGPKRRKYDLQVPEGFYQVSKFNPNSSYHLALGVNYPNPSDRILGEKNNLGGSIAIHGGCVTVGCIPLKDSFISELYIYCLEARNNGQNPINITSFPCKLSDANYARLQKDYEGDMDRLNLWEDLKIAYDNWNNKAVLPKVEFMKNGRHKFIK